MQPIGRRFDPSHLHQNKRLTRHGNSDKVNIEEINSWINLIRKLLKENPNDAKRKILEMDLESYLTCKRLIDEGRKK